MFKKLALILTGLTLFAANAQADEKAEAEAFFNKFAAMVDTYDQNIATLYWDEARIDTKRRAPDGSTTMVNQHPLKWKRVMVLAMQLGEIRKDKTDFTNVTVTPREDGGFKVKADRYSHLLCYKDSGYFQIVKKKGGQWLIIQEYLETQEQNDCAG